MTEQDEAQWKRFGAWVRARRGEMKPDRWTQKRLADELTEIGQAVTREWIVQVEQGKRPSADLVRAIERLFGPAPDFTSTSRGGEDQGSLVAATLAQNELLSAQNAILSATLTGIKEAFDAQRQMFESVLSVVTRQQAEQGEQLREWRAEILASQDQKPEGKKARRPRNPAARPRPTTNSSGQRSGRVGGGIG
jgi:hypothetical protein